VLAEIDKRLDEELAQLNQWVQSIARPTSLPCCPRTRPRLLEFLSQQTYYDMSGKPHPMLDPQEFRFLSIRKGTLDAQERLEMESHVTHSFHFLTKIPWTPVMRGIPRSLTATTRSSMVLATRGDSLEIRSRCRPG